MALLRSSLALFSPSCCNARRSGAHARTPDFQGRKNLRAAKLHLRAPRPPIERATLAPAPRLHR
eukprot:12572409-Alexandrium_andersonii.AAC.1